MVESISVEVDLRAYSEDFPQLPEEVVDAVTLVPRERLQQRSAEKIEDVPQYPEETVEAVKTALQ